MVEQLVEIAVLKETGLKRELVSLILDVMNLRCLQYTQVDNVKIYVHCRMFRIHVFWVNFFSVVRLVSIMHCSIICRRLLRNCFGRKGLIFNTVFNAEAKKNSFWCPLKRPY